MGFALMDSEFASKNQVPLITKSAPIPLEGFDGSPGLSITQHTSNLKLSIADHCENIQMDITRIAHADIFIGINWLQHHNPLIDWSERRIIFDKQFCIDNCRSQAVENHPVAAFSLFSKPPVQPTPDTIPPIPETTPSSSSISFVSAAAFKRTLKNSTAYVLYIRDAEKPPVKVAATASSKNPGPNLTSQIPPEYHEYLGVFSETAAAKLPERRPYDHQIPIEEGKSPPFGRLYSMSREELKELQSYLQENLSKGFIRASKSPAGAPVLFAKKKDGSLRLCVDYRGLNAITVKNRHPLPLISESLDRLSGAKYFTKIDLRGAYTHIRIAQGDEWKTAFRTRYGHFEYLIMPFGLTNAPASFQSLMNDLFRDMFDICVIIYLDDILIFSSTLEEHRKHVLEVLKRLQQHRLYAKVEKCSFHTQEVEYLGFIVTTDGVKMDPAKISAIRDWPKPTSIHDIQSFLGFANFYRRFIEGYSKTIAPLTRLLQKDVPWNFDDKAERAFETLKTKFTSAPVLTHYDPNLSIIIETDASDVAVGAVCSHSINKRLHPIAFHSRKLSPAELNYEIHDKELLAIIEAFKIWRPYIEGAQLPVDVFCDHNNLRYFSSSKVLSRRQTRWSQFLNAYNYVLHYRPGYLNGKPDALSRRPDFLKGGKAAEAAPQVVLAPHRFALNGIRLSDISLIPSQSPEFLERIKALYSQDETIKDLLPLLRDRLLPRTPKQRNQLSGLTLEEDILLHHGLVYIPDDNAIKLELLQHAHDSPSGGHYGYFKTFEVLSRDYHWPGMRKYVQEYCRTCDTCNRSKPIRHAPFGQLNPLPVAQRPWASISFDHITDLPLVQDKYDAILVVADRFSKQSHFILASTRDSANDLARQFVANVYRLHGLPTDIVSDRGRTFVSDFWRALCEILRIRPNYSVAYHPQTDGQTERTNQTMETYLRCFISYQQDDWDQYLPLAEFSYNNTVHSATNVTPFFALHGYHPTLTITPSIRTTINAPDAREFAERMEYIHRQCILHLQRAQDRMRQYYDRDHIKAPTYTPGDQVWLLRRRQHDSIRPSEKLDYKRIGPLQIIEVVGSSRSAYRLRLPAGDRSHNVFSVVDLEPYRVNTIPGREIPVPPPVVVGDRRYYEVEDILDSRIRYGKLEYKVHWTGWPRHAATFQTMEDPVAGVRRMIERFHANYPEKPGPHNIVELLNEQANPPRRNRRRR